MFLSRIEIIIGPMFSGKSTELLRRLNRYNAININTLVINHTLDKRTNNSIKTHNNLKMDALKVTNLVEIIDTDTYKKASIIGIDEAQFFSDLKEFIVKSESQNKTIIIAGLDGDYLRKPFGQILECIPLCDDLLKLKSMCTLCKDGTPALFSKRIIEKKDKVLVGDKEYIAVCRKHYN